MSFPKPQQLVLIDPAFVMLRFESRDWSSFAQHSFHGGLRNGLRELTASGEHWRLAIGDLAHLSMDDVPTFYTYFSCNADIDLDLKMLNSAPDVVEVRMRHPQSG